MASALDVLGAKWSILLVRDMLAGPKRFSELLQNNPGLSPRILSLRLKELQAAGLIVRHDTHGIRYEALPAAEEARPVIEALETFGTSR